MNKINLKKKQFIEFKIIFLLLQKEEKNYQKLFETYFKDDYSLSYIEVDLSLILFFSSLKFTNFRLLI